MAITSELIREIFKGRENPDGVEARLFQGRKKLRVKLKRYLESISSHETKQGQRVVRPRVFRRQLASSACD
jgi:hypothetical protein